MKWQGLGLTLCLLACGEAEPTAPPSAPALELGTGSWRFEPLEDGQEVELVHGAQGGWHMWISLRATGAAVDHAMVQLAMEPADQSRPRQQVSLELPFEAPDEQGARKIIGFTGVVNDPSCWVDTLVHVEATLTTDDGTLLSDEHEVLLRGGVYPPPPCTNR